MIPAGLPSAAKRSGVLPSPASASARVFMSAGISSIEEMNFRLPPRSFLPSSTAETPFPGRASKFSVSFAERFSSLPFFMIAFASGCSLFASRESAREKSEAVSKPSAGTVSVTTGSPLVTVPVLSSATILILPVSSSEAAVLKSIPFFAPMPLPTIIATGVASPSAHGQLMTSTEMPRASAYAKSLPMMSHTARVKSEMPITTGTKTPDTRSAIFAIGAFVAAASLTVFMICDSVVSSPTRVASQRRKPD